MSSAKWRPFLLGVNVLSQDYIASQCKDRVNIMTELYINLHHTNGANEIKVYICTPKTDLNMSNAGWSTEILTLQV